mgnify:CR=1 FL=1
MKEKVITHIDDVGSVKTSVIEHKVFKATFITAITVSGNDGQHLIVKVGWEKNGDASARNMDVFNAIKLQHGYPIDLDYVDHHVMAAEILSYWANKGAKWVEVGEQYGSVKVEAE